MIWKSKKRQKYAAKKAWHKHFCWLPTQVDDNDESYWVWLESVERIGHSNFDVFGECISWTYNYRLIKH